MKSVFIKTYGCSFNQSDSEIMAGLLEKSGRYKIVDSETDADLVIINSCTVKNAAETKFWRDIKNIKKIKVLAGCVPQSSLDKKKFEGYSVIGTNQINMVVDVVDETLGGSVMQLFEKGKNPRLNIPKIRKNTIIEIVPINEGCLGSCNFCMTKFARGNLISYPIDDIVRHIRDSLNEGVREIWLTSQDTFCYGYDIKTDIVELLKKILEMKRDFKIRIGMGNPDYLNDYLDELLDLMKKDDRIYRFLHIPLQAGSDTVLKDMRRNYTAESFITIIKKIKKEIPDITIATDIICGYPGETDEDFLLTKQILLKTRPDAINVSRFWKRPGTVAAKKKQLPTKTIKLRGIEMTKLYHEISIENNRKWLGWQGKILISEKGNNDTWVGRNFAYKPVVVKGDLKIGDEIKVKIVETTGFDLRGEAIKL